MRRLTYIRRLMLLCAALGIGQPLRAGLEFPTFKAQQLSEKVTVGYGLLLVDVKGGRSPDIVVADSKRVIWFENPTWTMHTILEGQTLPDNVAIAPVDVGGRLGIVLGAGWKGYNTKDNSTLQWLEPGSDVRAPWTLVPIPFDQASLHRIHTAAVDGKQHVIVAPLLGRGATKEGNFSQTTPGLLAYSIPANPAKGPWTPTVITDQLHVTHNFTPVDWNGDGKTSLLVASYEGIWLLTPATDGKWDRKQIGSGDQSNPNAGRGTSEVKMGRTKSGKKFIAAIEPWHGNQAVIYTPGDKTESLWTRKVLDDTLAEGHGVVLADLDGDGTDDVIVCSRGGKPGPGRGVFAYTADTPAGDVVDAKWTRHVIDDQEMAAEDIAAADLNGDGRIDVVAAGRATHNIRIYWNQPNK